MAEQPVFWLGGKPGNKNKGSKPPAAGSYEEPLREACGDCGYNMEEYVVAMGAFGGWLAHLVRDGKRYRLFWNGKSNELMLERFGEHGGWHEVDRRETRDEGLQGFTGAVQAMLRES